MLLRILCIISIIFSNGAFARDWESRRLLSEFRAEDAAVGDINGDGKADIAYGPFWFAGPDFTEQNRFATGDAFAPMRGYSDNFFSFIQDFDGDGKNDILVFGFPGKEARLYLNKAEADGLWPMHIVADIVAGESPTLIDLIPGGLPEIVCSRQTAFGYYEAGADVTQAWTWHPVSEKGVTHELFGHGMGVGDLSGDGRLDVIDRMNWYEHPAKEGEQWKTHRWALSPALGGAQMLVTDVDGDGDSDFISSLQAHGHGIAWFEQKNPGKFVQHDLVGASSTDNPYGVCFSQPHALELADVDGDGVMDFVTGKRWMAHQGKDTNAFQAPLLYWFRCVRGENGSVEFVPHLVDDDSGVGVGVTVADVDGNGTMDIISGNKKGLSVHLQVKDGPRKGEPRWQVEGGHPQDNYGVNLNAEQARELTDVPDGFSVDVIAAEPEIVQPIAMCFDARGRIWVVEGLTYPQPAPNGEGKDRIVILEDADADGTFETKKVFMEGLNLVSGIEIGFGGVWIGAAPNFMFIADKNGDDVPDGKPEILLDGWGQEDTHETLNSFTWGPDGWLYGCHGVFTHSKVGKPGTADADRVPLNAAVWRYHPVKHVFEVFAHGTSNPWGLDFNEVGDWFISSCVIPHFFHMVQGGRYVRQAGQHFNPYTFGEIDTIADHKHYAGAIGDHAFWGDKFVSRPAAPADTSALGGGHAHCGLALYLADVFPPEYRGDAFFHNLHGHRIVRERLEKDGSSYTARHRPDFLLSNNHDFIGVGIMLGPDGALYYSDWVDAQTCHHRDVEIWNRTNGRIFRVRYGDVRTKKFDLQKESDVDLAKRIFSPNVWFARQAQRILQERAAAGTLNGADVAAVLKSGPEPLRAMWALHAAGLLSVDELKEKLTDSNEYVRSWAVHLLGENGVDLGTWGDGETSLVTKRYMASLLQRLPHDQRWRIAETLMSDPAAQHDRIVPLLVWYGIEPLIDVDPKRVLAMTQKSEWGQVREFVFRRAALSETGREMFLLAMAQAKDVREFEDVAGQLLQALSKLPEVSRPKGWDEARARGRELKVGDALDQLGARFGDAEFFPYWRSIAGDEKVPSSRRAEALGILSRGNDPELGPIARAALAQPNLQGAAVAALKSFPGDETANALVGRLAEFPADLRNDAVNLLATRADMAMVLLKSVDSKAVPASVVSPVMLDQFERFENAELSALIGRNWSRGNGGVDAAQLKAAMDGWKAKLNAGVISKANASRGRLVFQNTCGTCHQMFGEGVALGPDLTGSNRADLGYILENVLAPSALVGRDYMLHIFTLKDKRVVSGVVREESPEFVIVAMPGGTLTDVKLSEVDKREVLPQSLMPPVLFDALPLEQVADLVKYLGSPNQVSLPGEAPIGADDDVPSPAKGVRRIEAETLADGGKVSGGTIQAQGMATFGKGWSGNSHLWWTGGKPADTLTLTLPLEAGNWVVRLFPTTAPDYAEVKVIMNGQIRVADLYTEKVLPGDVILFEKVTVSPNEALKIVIEISGKNAAALPAYMFGLDRIEVSPAG